MRLNNADTSHQAHLARGFNWLGGATLIAKVIDFATILIVLLFLTKQQVGVASLVVAIGMVIEATDGLGTSEALMQAPTITPLQLDTLFWFILAAAVLVAALTLLAAPWIAAAYGLAGMATYFWAVALKQPLVGIALIPLAIMNRDLQYERIAIVNVCATLAAALSRLGLAILGAGAWALVAGYALSGLYILIGALIAKPFLPRPRFHLSTILPLLRFGLRAAAANIFQQMFKNVDYLLVGWFYGPTQLAIYRVAFDVAMEPAVAVGTLVNRTALPVFARVAAIRADLAQAFQWSLRRLVTLIAPLAVGLILAAGPLTALLHDKQGHSYAAAAMPLKLLATAAVLRVTLELLFPVMIGSGRPGLAARLAATTLLLLSAGVLAAGFTFHAATGLIAVSAVWLAVYPPLLIWGATYLRSTWGIRPAALVQSFLAPILTIAAIIGAITLAQRLIGTLNAELQFAIALAAAGLTYAGLHRAHGVTAT